MKESKPRSKKNTSLQLHQALEYAENIISTLREPILVLDSELCVISANQSFYRVFSTTAEQTEGKLLYALNQGCWDIPSFRKLMADILPRNSSFEDFEIKCDFGELGTRTMLLNARRIHDGGIRTDRILLAIEDVTERLRFDKETAVSELRYRRLFETARDGILILDADCGEITDSNPFLTEMLGYSREEFVGKRLWEIGLFKDAAASRKAFQTLQEKGYVRYEDLPLETKDGRSVQVEFVSNVYPINSGRVIQCNIRDITARKQTESDLIKANSTLEKKVNHRTAKLRRANKQLGIYAARIIQSHENERKKVALELHDQLGQSLTFLKMNLSRTARSISTEPIPSLVEAQSLVSEIIGQVRRMALDLRPSMLDDLGLLPTLHWHIGRYTAQTNIKINFEHSGLETKLSPEISISVFRIVQEALTNIARHARVSQADVSVWADKNAIHIIVSDLGAGYDTSKSSLFASTGLLGMRERTLLLGGDFNIDSQLGKGTCLTAEIPLPKASVKK